MMICFPSSYIAHKLKNLNYFNEKFNFLINNFPSFATCESPTAHGADGLSFVLAHKKPGQRLTRQAFPPSKALELQPQLNRCSLFAPKSIHGRLQQHAQRFIPAKMNKQGLPNLHHLMRQRYHPCLSACRVVQEW